MTGKQIDAADWLDLNWSTWKSLHAGSFSDIPKRPGIYRIRHRDDSRPYLEYVGESGDTRRRIQSLARGTYADEMPYRDPHTAAPCLWAVRDAIGPDLEVSYTTPSKASDKQHRKGLEAALTAFHRRETNRSPTANFGRIIEGYKQSTYSYEDEPFKGGKLGSDDNEPNAITGIKPFDWKNWQNPVDRHWMGMEWSNSYRLENRLAANPPKNGLYRIWYEDSPLPLAYLGQSKNIPSRLYEHEATFGENTLFAYSEQANLVASHRREEIERDLIGAHYLGQNTTPLAQFGYTERLPRR